MIHELVQHLSEPGEWDDYEKIGYFYYLRRIAPNDLNLEGVVIGSGDICYIIHLGGAYYSPNPLSTLREMRDELRIVAEDIMNEAEPSRVHVVGFASPPIAKIMKHFSFYTPDVEVPEGYKESAVWGYKVHKLDWVEAEAKARSGFFKMCYQSGPDFLQRFHSQRT